MTSATWPLGPPGLARLPGRVRLRVAWLVCWLGAWLVSALMTVAVAQVVRVDANGVRAESAGPGGPAELAGASTVSIDARPLGRQARLLDEVPGQALTLDQARERLAAGAFRPSAADVPNLGNAAPPRWMHLAIDNAAAAPLDVRLYAAEGWVDRIDLWLVVPGGGVLRHWAAGDGRSPSRYLRVGLGYGFDAALPPGRSELYLRADSIDAAAMSLRIVPLARTAALEGEALRWTGLVHGFLLALVATYGLLWLALRDGNHGRYVAYVAAYLWMNVAYSGIGPLHAWPDSPAVARYAILVGMALFSSAGLGFARGFLDLATQAPRLDRIVACTVRVALAAMVLCIVADAPAAAVHVAFGYITLLTFSMVGLGLYGLRRGSEQAAFFLTATLIAMAGTLVTTLTVMGVLPFNQVSFRLVEVGVMLEATIWALALGLRLRRQRDDGAQARELARRDPLTALYNRRGFLEQALSAYSVAARRARPLAVMVIDIDHFKRINDQHGHAVGDQVLVEVADRLRAASRVGDVLARWGGEEFVMLLPETDAEQARAFAERLRRVIGQAPVRVAEGAPATLSASFGIAVRHASSDLDDLLRAADSALYAAKAAGRDRVVVDGEAAGPVREGRAA